jgi:hypothetical protein
MTIELRKYDNEAELHNWVERPENISSVFGEVIYLPGNFFIKTKRNKGGKPDGFVLDLKKFNMDYYRIRIDRTWCLGSYC